MATPIPEITTDRLVLRGFRPSDEEPFAALNRDPAVMEHMQGPMTRQHSDGMIERIDQCWRDRDWGLWAVEVRGVAPFIGYVGLWPADHVTGDPMTEVGWRIAHDHWGHGYVTEAAREALRFGFVEVGLDEIVSFTVPQNVRSWRVMERIGLERDPSRDFDHSHVDGVAYPELVGHVFYALDRQRWLDSVTDG